MIGERERAVRASQAGAGASGAEPAAGAAGLPAGVRRRQPPRELVRTVNCPRCGASPGEFCQGRRGPRKSNHLERVELATELRFGQRLELPRTVAQTRASAGPSSRASGDPEGVDGPGGSTARLGAGPGSELPLSD